MPTKIEACTLEDVLPPKRRPVNERLQKHRNYVKRIEEIIASGQAAKIDLSDESNLRSWVTSMQISLRNKGIAIRKVRRQPTAYALPAAKL